MIFSPDLYILTDEKIGNKEHILIAKEAIEGGATVIQLREKDKNDRQLFSIATEMSKLCHKHRVKFIVNDRVDIAILSKADGVHLGQYDIPLKEARKLVPNGFIIGVSTHNLREAKEAEREGADYISVGSIFPTKTKVDATLVGIKTLKEITATVKIPVVAIGGINLENLKDVLDAGANGIAVISAIISQKNIKEATRKFRKQIQYLKG